MRHVHRLWFRYGIAGAFCSPGPCPLVTWDARQITCPRCLRIST